MGERLPCKQEVSGSIPLISTTSSQASYRSLPAEAESSFTTLLVLTPTNPVGFAGDPEKAREQI